MSAITQIFRTFGDEYIAQNPHMPLQHKKTIDAIINCRSGAYGVTVYRCDKCGKKHLIDRSCGNRHCPQCQYHKSRQWLDAQLERRLPGGHFLLTFTLPEELRPFCRSHQDAAYGAMFKAASESIKKLAKDPRLIGADLPGFTAVLHTWGRQMQYHPHLHLIVPSVWQMAWNANCQPIGSSEAALKYLAPYIFRVAISNSRITAVKERNVFFSYRKKGSNRPRLVTLDAREFIRRFLQHVLPSGFMKVRHYGFMSSNCAVSPARLRLLILEALKKWKIALADLPPIKPKPAVPKIACPTCGGCLLYLFSLIPDRSCRGST